MQFCVVSSKLHIKQWLFSLPYFVFSLPLAVLHDMFSVNSQSNAVHFMSCFFYFLLTFSLSVCMHGSIRHCLLLDLHFYFALFQIVGFSHEFSSYHEPQLPLVLGKCRCLLSFSHCPFSLLANKWRGIQSYLATLSCLVKDTCLLFDKMIENFSQLGDNTEHFETCRAH